MTEGEIRRAFNLIYVRDWANSFLSMAKQFEAHPDLRLEVKIAGMRQSGDGTTFHLPKDLIDPVLTQMKDAAVELLKEYQDKSNEKTPLARVFYQQPGDAKSAGWYWKYMNSDKNHGPFSSQMEAGRSVREDMIRRTSGIL